MKKKIDFITAELFLLFTFYQIILITQYSANRFGRFLGTAAFAVITVAAFIPALSDKMFKTLHMTLLIAGLTANFLMKLFNAQVIFGKLNFSYLPSVLNCGVFIFSELGIFLLLFYYLIFRRNLFFARKMKARTKWKISKVLLLIVIALYAASLAMECVLLIKLHKNIELNLYCTVMIRFIYFFAFAFMTAGFMITHPKTEIHSYTKPDKNEKPSKAQIDKDYIIQSGVKNPGETVEKQKTTRAEFDSDFIIKSGVEDPASTVEPAKTSRKDFDNDYIL